MKNGFSLVALVAATLGAACSGTTVVDDDDSGSDSSSTGNVDPNAYVLDFTKSEQGGMALGSNLNVAFALELSESTREYKMMSVGGDQLKPGLILTYDFAACDVSGSVATNATKLEVIDVANVAEVQIEMLNLGGQVAPLGIFCFGYRVPNDGWHWVVDEADRIPVTYDETTDRFHVRIPIDKGPIDGVKLMTDAGSRAVTTITYVVEP